MNALAIARVNVRRLLRDRSTLFFVFIFPLLIIVLLGSAFGGGFTPRVALTGPAVEGLEPALGAHLEVRRVETAPDVVEAVSRGQAQIGLVMTGEDRAEIVVRPENLPLRAAVETALQSVTTTRRAARFASAVLGGDEADHLARAEQVAPHVPEVAVTVTREGDGAVAELGQLGRFDLGATSQLLLFVFLTSLTGAVALIQTRRLGVSRRMLASPTRTHTILAGEGLGRLGVALVQGAYIMLGSALLFGVDWGDPLAAAAVVTLFATTSAAAALLLGATLSNDAQAGGVGLLLGLGLGALGGAMVPLEFFPPTMATVAKATPHAWALDAFAELLRRDGTLADVLPQLGVLALFTLVLGAAATWRLHRTLTA